MPQFDILSFSSQVFWLFLFLFFTYGFLSYYLLPSLAASMKVRNRFLVSTFDANADNSLVFSFAFELSKRFFVKYLSFFIVENIFFNFLKKQFKS
jgi:hypothetical protein